MIYYLEFKSEDDVSDDISNSSSSYHSPKKSPLSLVQGQEKKNLRIPQNDNNKIIVKEKENIVVTPPDGVIVLGMHRSGTSMLSGLLVKGLGYKTGGPLIGQSFDNKKGFFERIDIVLQNDEFLKQQRTACDKKTYISIRLSTEENRNDLQIFMVQALNNYSEFPRILNKSAQYLCYSFYIKTQYYSNYVS